MSLIWDGDQLGGGGGLMYMDTDMSLWDDGQWRLTMYLGSAVLSLVWNDDGQLKLYCAYI